MDKTLFALAQNNVNVENKCGYDILYIRHNLTAV